jgi:hypothetical protein
MSPGQNESAKVTVEASNGSKTISSKYSVTVEGRLSSVIKIMRSSSMDVSRAE